MKTFRLILKFLIFLALLASCSFPSINPQEVTPTESQQPIPTIEPTGTTAPTATMAPLKTGSVLTISPGVSEKGQFISLLSGGDVDTVVVNIGSAAGDARITGNGKILSAPDGNKVQDSYMQFNVDNIALFNGIPTPSIQLEIEYLDKGIDAFTVEYDAMEGGPYGNGTFMPTRPVYKTNTGNIKKETFILKDIRFTDSDNGADFRIADLGDGAETITRVSITTLRVPTVINVDTCGANPFDENPDSDDIQECIYKARLGDIVTFTSGEKTAGYTGYLIDKTIYMQVHVPVKYLTFTSTNPQNPALLKATKDLKGFVMKMIARSQIPGNQYGETDYQTVSYLHIDSNRAERVCNGPNGINDGVDDNWGATFPGECNRNGDPWCLPGGLLINSATQNFDSSHTPQTYPSEWTTGVLIDSVHISNVECGTGLGFGGADSAIINSVVEVAGDHVHGYGCSLTDKDTDGKGAWSDGITFDGTNNQILNNTVIDPSDIGIVFFGGQKTVIRNNTIRTTEGNYGAFGGIAIHPWIIGSIAFSQVIGNTVENNSDTTCGGLHTGIDIGTHMWGGGCTLAGTNLLDGNSPCSLEPAQPKGSKCTAGQICQIWAHIPGNTEFTLADNKVTGAHINYLVEGLDVEGEFIQYGNTSITPQMTDWQAARGGCDGITWGPMDFVAHHPTLEGWTNLRIHCER